MIFTLLSQSFEGLTAAYFKKIKKCAFLRSLSVCVKLSILKVVIINAHFFKHETLDHATRSIIGGISDRNRIIFVPEYDIEYLNLDFGFDTNI